MKWIKSGQIFSPGSEYSDWVQNYAALPVADLIEKERLRIYFSTRDHLGRSIPTYGEFDPKQPQNLTYLHKVPILNLGELGTFDDSGIMPSWILDVGERKYLYYIGWNPQKTVSYRLSIGLAISDDGGITFTKHSNGPILDRDVHEPFFNTAPCVLLTDNKYMMWYVSCTGWQKIKGWPEPFYNIKCAESEDGITWVRLKADCIEYDAFTQAIGKPCVYLEDGIFKMLYSYRNATDYRIDRNKGYRLGYAESENGINWTRLDSKVGIRLSKSGWDSQMMEYCSTYMFNGKRHLIYNGNGFGKEGFGHATQIEK